MRLIKAIFVVAPIVAAIYIASKAIEQFEHFQESGAHYLTSFHEIDMVVLVLAVVALVAFAICMISADLEYEEFPVRLDDYLRSVLSGTAGVVLFTIGIYQQDIEDGNALPSHLGKGYHSGDSTLVFLAGLLFILLAVYFLFRNWNAYRVVASATTDQRVHKTTAEERRSEATAEEHCREATAKQQVGTLTEETLGLKTITIDPVILMPIRDIGLIGVLALADYLVSIDDELDNSVDAEAEFKVEGEPVKVRYSGKVEDVTYGLTQIFDFFFPEETK